VSFKTIVHMREIQDTIRICDTCATEITFQQLSDPNNSELRLGDAWPPEVLHFCSRRCLAEWVNKPSA
jgi:hypothetical protein